LFGDAVVVAVVDDGVKSARASGLPLKSSRNPTAGIVLVVGGGGVAVLVEVVDGVLETDEEDVELVVGCAGGVVVEVVGDVAGGDDDVVDVLVDVTPPCVM
jgi:hypothetical protein